MHVWVSGKILALESVGVKHKAFNSCRGFSNLSYASSQGKSNELIKCHETKDRDLISQTTGTNEKSQLSH